MEINDIFKHIRHIEKVLFRIENDTFYDLFPKQPKVKGDDKRSMSKPP